MASIESTWDLRCDSSPRSISVDIAPSVPSQSTAASSNTASSTTSGSSASNPMARRVQVQSRGSAPITTNPFDAVFDSTTKTGIKAHGNLPTRSRNTNPFSDDFISSSQPPQQPTQKQQQAQQLSSGYGVLVGTEKGSIHHRTFPTSSAVQQSRSRNAFATSADSIVQPLGLDGTSSDRVHPLHRPLDSGADDKYAIVACIRANAALAAKTPSNLNLNDAATASAAKSAVASSQLQPTTHSSIYLLLQQGKDRNSSKGSSSNEGAYTATIISTHHITSSTSTIIPSQQLPRMSCATHHPNCGFVYAAGSSICSLPPKAVRAVSSALNATLTSRKGVNVNGVSSSSSLSTVSASITASVGNASASINESAAASFSSRSYYPSIYYNAIDILPSTVRSGMDCIAFACNGRVIIVACGNAFYAVSGTSVPHGTWYTKEEEEQLEEAKEEAEGLFDDYYVHDSGGIVGGGGIRRGGEGSNKGHDFEKVLKFRQSSQVHPAIVVEVPLLENFGDGAGGNLKGHGYGSMDAGMDDETSTSLLFLGSGRECAVVEVLHNPRLYSNSSHKRSSLESNEDDMLLPSPSISCGSIVVGSPRRGIATIASPILAAVGIQSTSRRTGPLMAILTSDGLVHTRSPSCIAIPLSTIEVGTRPNDYFALRSLPNKQVVAASYGGEGRLISFREDTVQDLADRMMKLSIDAFANDFPRAELAEAVEAKFSAASYVGPEPTNAARTILRQYLETILGLDIHEDFSGGDASSWFFEGEEGDPEADHDKSDYKGFRNASRSPHASTFISATAILCLLCTQLSPINPSLANRAAKSCAAKLGVVSTLKDSGINASSVQLCKKIVQLLLAQSEKVIVDDPAAGVTPSRSGARAQMEFVEAATWLLRSCGQHKHAISIQQERMSNLATSNGLSRGKQSISQVRPRGTWSQLKYESFTATHLGELWSHGDDSCRDLVLNSPAIHQLLETNPMLGLGVFTTLHPSNEEQWTAINSLEEPVISPTFPKKVVALLKTARPLIPHDRRARVVEIEASPFPADSESQLPLESGRALAVTYLESLVGISTKKPPAMDPVETSESMREMHNELALLLLEGVLSERSDNEAEADSTLGSIYRSKLRRLLGWSNAAVSPDILMKALPTSFLRERALVLGQLGRHEDALRIFYCQLNSIDLALEYCDARYEKQQAQLTLGKRASSSGRSHPKDTEALVCPYLPLVSVALKTNEDADRGISAAIRVLSLRRENIDRTAALRLLPKHIPISALSKSFLIPALIDSESQARRMTVVASLLKAKYVRLKQTLSQSQIKSQSSLHTVPTLRSLNLGEPVYSSQPFKARPSSVTTHFPEISIIKYFFPRYVIIQTMVTNSAPGLEGKTLGDLQLIVAESSDEALLPSIIVPIKTLPPKITGSAWCVLAASPQRLDGSAILTCELRYKVLDVDSMTGAPLSFSSGHGMTSISFVEEIQDIEIRRAEFEG